MVVKGRVNHLTAGTEIWRFTRDRKDTFYTPPTQPKFTTHGHIFSVLSRSGSHDRLVLPSSCEEVVIDII